MIILLASLTVIANIAILVAVFKTKKVKKKDISIFLGISLFAIVFFLGMALVFFPDQVMPK